MKNMRLSKYFFCFLFTVIISGLSAQKEVENYENLGLEWYLNKAEALDSARSQGKQVFLLWGQNSCGNCSYAKRSLAKARQKELMDAHYVPLFLDYNIYDRFAPEVDAYLPDKGPIAFPVLCVIDTADIDTAHGYSSGYKSEDALFAMLNQYQYVSNEDCEFFEDASFVFVSGNHLVVKNSVLNEIISVYTITGRLVEQFHKTKYETKRDVSAYPDGVLIVNSSSGWAQKISMHR